MESIRSVEVIKKPHQNIEIMSEVPLLAQTFNDFTISPEVLRNVLDKGYVTTTPIQQQTIPAILQGRDVIGIANTGTGKTAAFLIPLVSKVVWNKSEKVLIIAPTRELAVQIHDE